MPLDDTQGYVISYTRVLRASQNSVHHRGKIVTLISLDSFLCLSHHLDHSASSECTSFVPTLASLSHGDTENELICSTEAKHSR